jgi:hypothetical protein
MEMKPTKKNSPAVKVGRNPNNKPAEAYEKNGVGVEYMDAAVSQKVDPNSRAAKDVNPTTLAMRVSIGNPGRDDVKTTGIKIRGTGAAEKGTMARGPMA